MVQRFDRASLHTAAVLDAVEGFGYVAGLTLHTDAGKGETLVGNASTVWCRPGDNLGVREAIRTIEPGAVLVIAGSATGDTALVGDQLYAAAVRAGVGSIVLDGYIRDSWVVAQGPMPVYCRGIVPRPPTKTGPFRLQTSVAIGNVPVMPGDVVIADEDGVVVVPHADADAVIREARSGIAAELATDPA